MTIEHSTISFGEIHPVANWAVTAGGVAALSGIPVGDGDIGKVAWVAGVGHYVLASTSPAVWESLGVTITDMTYDNPGATLSIALSDGTTHSVDIVAGLSESEVNTLIDGALTDLTTANIPDSTDKRYVSDAQLAVLGNTSGTNSGDETTASIKTKLGAASSTQDGYLTSTDWSTFNGKQAALADVITAGAYGSSTQWPVITVNTKGIVTGVTLQTVPTPTLTDATFSVQKNGSPSIAASWDLSALTASCVHTYPNKAIDFSTLSSVGASDDNTLSGTRTRILGGFSNTVDGTGNVAINCVALGNLAGHSNVTLINSAWRIAGSGVSGVVAIGARNVYLTTPQLKNTIVIGSANNTNLFTRGVAACTQQHSLFAASSSFPVSGTLYATENGSQTLSTANCLQVPSEGGTSQYEVDFIVSVGISTSAAPTGCSVMKRIFTVFTASGGSASISPVDTVGTDRTLGTISGTFTPVISIVANTHVTVGITRAGGVAGQEAMMISARVRTHLNV